MPSRPDSPSLCQQLFQQRWGDLRDPHVRTLAWLLEAPDMLDADWLGWGGRVTCLAQEIPEASQDWLRALDRNSDELHAHLDAQRTTRLGRYAEQLLAWHFRARGLLHAQGVQVREGDRTLGEFDFLLRHQGRLLHRELATKVYLLRRSPSHEHGADYFVGPNLADTLGAKLGKILERQLTLSTAPAAAQVLPGPVDSVGAWVKGWLFYPQGESRTAEVPGLSSMHCRGMWCTLDEFAAFVHDRRYLILQRLQWLTPQLVSSDQLMTAQQVLPRLEAEFARQNGPIMLAAFAEEEGMAREWSRCFVVPEAWQARAALPR